MQRLRIGRYRYFRTSFSGFFRGRGLSPGLRAPGPARNAIPVRTERRARPSPAAAGRGRRGPVPRGGGSRFAALPRAAAVQDFLAVLFVVVFLAVVFFAVVRDAVFFAGALARRSARSSAARSTVIDSTSSPLRREALLSPSVT